MPLFFGVTFDNKFNKDRNNKIRDMKNVGHVVQLSICSTLYDVGGKCCLLYTSRCV